MTVPSLRPAQRRSQPSSNRKAPGLKDHPPFQPAGRKAPPRLGGRLEGLTGLRAIAALWVLTFHYRLILLKPFGLADVFPPFTYGYLGVDLFFMLSGFVIAHVHGRDFLDHPGHRTFLRFIALRAARLYPVYLVALGLLAILLWLSARMPLFSLNPRNYGQTALAFQVAMVQTWGFTRHLQWNYPDWSVSAEWFAYLLFPIAVVPLLRLGKRGVLCALGVLLLGLAGVYLGPFHRTFNQAIGFAALLRAAGEFAIGCLLRRLLDVASPTEGAWRVLAVAVGSTAVATCLAYPALGGLVPVLLFPPFILASSLPDNAVSRAFSWRPLVRIGEASYSLYLMQAPVERATHVLKEQYLTLGPLYAVGVTLAYAALLVLGSLAMHHLVERPARRRLRAWINTRLPHQGTSRSAEAR